MQVAQRSARKIGIVILLGFMRVKILFCPAEPVANMSESMMGELHIVKLLGVYPSRCRWFHIELPLSGAPDVYSHH